MIKEGFLNDFIVISAIGVVGFIILLVLTEIGILK